MRVLFLGSHCDDIELGCGATIAKHNHDWEIYCAVFSNTVPLDGGWACLKLTSEQSLATLGVQRMVHFDFRTNHFHQHRQQIWETINSIKSDFNPDLVFTHLPDEQQDHETIHNETIRNFQNTSVLLYKPTMRYLAPIRWQWIESVDRRQVDAKLTALTLYKDYHDKLYFRPDNVEAQLRVCGMECGQDYAEGFEIIRLIQE